ncbi:MAG: N-formylglutamate amidohydrolase [Rhodospirillales bacterium]|nr:N-formylglutamate amidohydrolase [Rhodospirillales bacterium]
MGRPARRTIPGVLYVETPAGPPVPVLFDSPHSGVDMPDDFAAAVSEQALLDCADLYVDELYASASARGVVQVCALFPRAYIDPNRAESDIDAELLDGEWPGPVEQSMKTELGIGLVWRLAAPGVPMYARKLSVDEVKNRIETYYRPYHSELQSHLDELHGRFGAVWHVDCHCMKSRGNAMTPDGGRDRPDFVVSDGRGITCGPAFTAFVSDTLRGMGYSVAINDPFQGAEVIHRHGDPAKNRHSLQIEINRGLYMDEDSGEKTEGFDPLKAHLDQLTADICDFAMKRCEAGTAA